MKQMKTDAPALTTVFLLLMLGSKCLGMHRKLLPISVLIVIRLEIRKTYN
jgi:hypothetical protein